MVVQHVEKYNNKNMTRFIDYFFICGLPENERPRIYKHHEDIASPEVKERKLVSTILDHFPKEVQGNPWNSAELWRLCTPTGISVIHNSQTSSSTHFHSFVLTKEDGTRTYGHVLTFFEPIVIEEIRNDITNLLQILPAGPENELYIQKCFGFITQFGLINTCEKILRRLLKLFVGTENQFPVNLSMESYIYNLLYELPPLTAGCSFKLSCMGHEDPVIVQQPSLSELPLLDIHLSEVFHLLGGAKNLLSFLTSLLLEHKILLVSEDSRKLIVAAEGVVSLLFPFQWQHPYVSVLSYELATPYLDAPVPYIIGVLANNNEKNLIRQGLEVNQCYVDLDNAVVESPEEQPLFPNHNEILLKINNYVTNYINELKAIPTSSNEFKSGNVSPTQNINQNENTSKDSGVEVSETLTRVANLAKKAGIIESVEDINNLHANVGTQSMATSCQVNAHHLCEHKLNIGMRETLASVFLTIFSQYDKFVIQQNKDDNGMRINFDKTSFLSDQPEVRLRFLYSFLDTQMFATFIDSAIIFHQSGAEEKDEYLRLFDDRIENAKGNNEARSPSTIDPSNHQTIYRTISTSASQIMNSTVVDSWIQESEHAIEKRLKHVDMMSSPPHNLVRKDDMEAQIAVQHTPGTLPHIRGFLLEEEGYDLKKRHLRRRNDSRRTLKRQPTMQDSKLKRIQDAKLRLLRQQSMSEYSPELIARTNWIFVEKLLKDVKLKTKKLLVGKMGQEAIDLGHGELNISDLEENTWIASLCDLLERVWSHGLLTNHKKGKSALWSHLLQYQLDEEQRHYRTITKFTGTSISDDIMELPSPPNFYYSLPRSISRRRTDGSLNRLQDKRSSSNHQLSSSNEIIPKVQYSVISAMRRVQEMKEVQTEVGRSRAWIRLSLEQKQLQSYLTELLNNHQLLNLMYKKYSLLQCEDQREQFLFHILSLNAVDFNSFTNSYKSTMEYKVWILPGRQFSGSSQTSANVYMSVKGELSQTNLISVPKNCQEFTFKHQNLGLMTTLTIGHDNAGLLPKWLLDGVVVRNEVTGQTTCFPLNRWLGRGVDDNGLERLLLAQIIPRDANPTAYAFQLARNMSRTLQPEVAATLQENVGQAVNVIVKFLLKPVVIRDRSRLDSMAPPAQFTKLLMDGLVRSLEGVFVHGLKTGGLFRKKLFALDVISATFQSFVSGIKGGVEFSDVREDYSNKNVAVGGDWFLGNRNSSPNLVGMGQGRRLQPNFDSRSDGSHQKSEAYLEREKAAASRMCEVYSRINNDLSEVQKLGKDDVFNLLMCIGIHTHMLSLWLPKISEMARMTQQLYEDSAFLCDASAVSFLCSILNMLSDYDIPLDSSLLRGHADILRNL